MLQQVQQPSLTITPSSSSSAAAAPSATRISDPLFEPFTIRNRRIKNRIVFPVNTLYYKTFIK